MSWNNLPTNYSDATWVGDRKYTINLNDGHASYTGSTITDTTTYEPASSGGNIFYGANDANQTNDAINKIVAALGNDINDLKVNIANGGTGATTALNALINLGVSDTNQTDFQANSYSEWLSAVQTYVDQNLQARRPFVFHAGWQGVGYGSGLAYQTLDSGFKFLMLFNENERSGVKYYFKRPNENNWNEASTNVGTTLYDNSSGTVGTVNLNTNVSLFSYIDIIVDDHVTHRVYSPDGKYTTLSTTGMDQYNTFYFNNTGVYISGLTITVNGALMAWTTNGGNMSVNQANGVKIYKVIGYK